MGRTACTEPQCLYSTAILLLRLWAVRPVQSRSACMRLHFLYCNTYHCDTIAYSVQYNNMLYRFVA
jgi:hypothetical protein